MAVYYTIHTLLFISCIFELSSIRVKKRVIILWAVFFTLFGGLRWRIGGDWEQYFQHFILSSWDNIFNYDRYGNGVETLEPGFVFINKLIKEIFGTFYWYNIIVVGFVQFTYYKFCNFFVPKHSLLLYALIMVLYPNYFPVRAGLAVAICYWTYRYIKNQQLWRFLFLVVVATFIHNQCLILLPFYWVGKIKMNLFHYTALFVLFSTCSVLFQDYFTLLSMSIGGSLAEKAYHYTQYETDGMRGASYLGWCLNYFFLLIYLYIRKIEKKDDDRWYNTLLNMFIVYIAIYMVFSENMGDLSRLANMFLPAQIILLTQSIICFVECNNRLLKNAAITFLILYYIYKIMGITSGYYFELACVPYRTIFDYQILN